MTRREDEETALRLRGIQTTDLLTWNTLEAGMQVVLAGGAVWDVVRADTKEVTVKHGTREVTRAVRDLPGIPRVVRSQELSRIMKARIANAETLLRDMLGATREALGLPPKPPGKQGFVVSNRFSGPDALASHLFILHAEKVNIGKNWKDDANDILKWHDELHEDIRPSDFPGFVPHVHWDKP